MAITCTYILSPTELYNGCEYIIYLSILRTIV